MSKIGHEVSCIWLKQGKSIGRIISEAEAGMVLILLNKYGKKNIIGWKVDENLSNDRKKYAGKYGKDPDNRFYWLSSGSYQILRSNLFLDNE